MDVMDFNCFLFSHSEAEEEMTRRIFATALPQMSMLGWSTAEYLTMTLVTNTIDSDDELADFRSQEMVTCL